jgi:Potential Queuosine, Q, salvage protein family
MAEQLNDKDQSNQNVFDEIRASTRSVCEGARFVRIVEDRIDDYARSLPLETIRSPQLDPAAHFIGSEDDTATFFVTLDAINFGSGYFPHLAKLPGRSGYFTIATHLTEHFRTHGLISPEQLADLTADDCRKIFHQQSDAGPVDELMGLFAEALRALGAVVSADYRSSFRQMIASAGNDPARMVKILGQMPFFEDREELDGHTVSFYKRAQLTVADLHLALHARGLGQFERLQQLTIFADNLVPHVLRCDGILQYDQTLAERIDAGQPIRAHSREEIEIRAAAVHACERIVEALGTNGQHVTSMQLDYLLWNRGQQPEYKARPRHRSRTVFY